MKSEAAKAAAKERSRKWRLANIEHVREKSRAYYASDPEAARVRQRKWYAANSVARRKRSEYHQARKIEARRKAFAHYGPDGRAACCRCGIDDADVLTLDHIDNDGAKHRKVDKQAKALCFWVAKKGFPEGFMTLCMNCNYKKHLERVRVAVAEKNALVSWY